MNKNRLAGLLLIVGGVIMHLAGYAGWSGTGTAAVFIKIVIPACLVIAGIALMVRRAAPPLRREQAAYYIPGFTPAHASKNLAIEGGSNRLWIRDPEQGEKVIAPENLRGWDRSERSGVHGIVMEIEDAYGPATWFIPFFHPADVDPWIARLNTAFGARQSE